MRTAIYQEVSDSIGDMDSVLNTLKFYSADKNHNCVIYKDTRSPVNHDSWRVVVFMCDAVQMEELYSNIAVKAIAQMLIRSVVWFGKEKPHFPIKGRPAVIFAWSKLGRQVEYHEMDAYPEVKTFISQLINNPRIRVT